jgi:hypothetical protein
MAVASVHALSWRRHAGGFGQRQVSSLTGESDAMTPDRPRTWPDGRAAETAKAPKPPHFRSVKERGLGRANAQSSENRQASAGRWTQLAGAKPDAGASAGDEALARPVARPGSKRLDIGRQVWPGAKRCRRFAGRIMSEGHPHAGESGVGSNAGPICITGAGSPLGSHFARVALRQRRSPMGADDQMFQRFIAFPGRLTPHRNPPGDEMLTWFAFGRPHALTAPSCGRELADMALMPAAPPRGACKRLP